MSEDRDEEKRERAFLVLFVCLLLMGAIHPVVSYGASGRVVLALGLTAVLVAAVRAVSSSVGLRRAGIVLALPAFVLNWVFVATPNDLAQAATFILSGAFYAFVSWRVSIEVFREGGFREDRIFGAASIYLLLGVMFASIYGFIETVHPGAFGGLDPAQNLRAEMMYFSFVTLTTLGYGDVSPVAPFARSLAIVEAVIGVLYIAIVIARLASANDNQKQG